MNVRPQASTVVARTPSAKTDQEVTFAHAQRDLNRPTAEKPMEKISHVKVSWLRPILRDRFNGSRCKMGITDHF